MKKLYILLLIATIGTFQLTYSQITFTGDITVATQAEVDALAENYTHITGRLNILAGDISDLSKFSDLQDIGRRLLIQDCPNITDMTDFSSLQAVGSLDSNEELVIRRMDGLTTLNGLQSLTSVGRRVGIRQNAVLTTLEGLNNLVSIGEDKINIGDAACGGDAAMSNPMLTDFCALQNLVSAVGVATLEAGGSCIDNSTAFNPSFTDISNGTCVAVVGVPIVGFDATSSGVTETNADQTVMITVTLSNYGGSQVDLSVTPSGTADPADYTLNTTSLSFTGNGSQDISLTIKDDADADDETVVLTLAETTVTGATVAPSVHTVSITDDDTGDITFTGDITVATQAEVDALAENYTHITGRLNILAGDISDLSKFSDLQDIGRRLLIQDCPNITDMTDFSSLQAVGSLDSNEELVIRRMDGLTTLNGLQSLTSVGRRVGIRQNAVLTTLEGLNNLVSIGEDKINIGDAACGGDAAMSNPMLTDFCALQNLVSAVGVATLEAGGSCIDNSTAFNPSFTDISNGTCAAPLSVTEFAEGSYRIYPNPVLDKLVIVSNEKLDSIKIINVLGKEVLRSKKNEIDVSGLSSGLYFVRISSNNKSALKKIIKY